MSYQRGLWILFVLILPNYSFAANCNALLSSGVFNYKEEVIGSNYIANIRQDICHNSVTSYQIAKNILEGGSLAGRHNLSVLDIEYDKKNAASHFEYWKYKFCSSSAAQLSSNDSIQTITKEASSVLANAFVDCVSRKGLHAWSERTADPKEFNFISRFWPINVPAARDVKIDLINASCKPDPTSFDEIGPGGITMGCTRKSPNDVARVVINSDSGSEIVTVNPYLAPTVPVEPKKCERSGARNFGEYKECKYGYFFGHKDRLPGVIYIWPSPWESNKYVWCNVPDHDLLLYGLEVSGGKVQYIGHDAGKKRYDAEYWSKDCTGDVFRQMNTQAQFKY